jgi:hypothetical protein
MENKIGGSSKTKNIIVIWPNNLTSGYVTKRIEDNNPKRYLHTSVHRSTIHKTQEIEATQIPIKGWMDKRNVAYT